MRNYKISFISLIAVRICLTLVLFLTLSACSSTIPLNIIGKQAPAARLYYTDGEIGSLADYQGEDLIVIFWASTCSHSFGQLQDVSEWKNKARDSRKYKILSINVDKAEKELKVTELLQKLGKSQFKHSYSGNDVYDEAYVAFDITDLPTVLKINRFGKVLAAGNSLSAVLD